MKHIFRIIPLFFIINTSLPVCLGFGESISADLKEIRYSCGFTLTPGSDRQRMKNIFFSLKVDLKGALNQGDQYTFKMDSYTFSTQLRRLDKETKHGALTIDLKLSGQKVTSQKVRGPSVELESVIGNDQIHIQCRTGG
jgi:hypothetical protein